MEPLERIRARIAGFPGYESNAERHRAEEEIRAYAGERLAGMPGAERLPSEARVRYERLLMRAEFVNQRALGAFEADAAPGRILALLEADAELLDAADALRTDPPEAAALERLERAFDRREFAMTRA